MPTGQAARLPSQKCGSGKKEKSKSVYNFVYKMLALKSPFVYCHARDWAGWKGKQFNLDQVHKAKPQ